MESLPVSDILADSFIRSQQLHSIEPLGLKEVTRLVTVYIQTCGYTEPSPEYIASVLRCIIEQLHPSRNSPIPPFY